MFDLYDDIAGAGPDSAMDAWMAARFNEVPHGWDIMEGEMLIADLELELMSRDVTELGQ